MATKKKQKGKAQEWADFDGVLREYVPNLRAWWGEAEEFGELRLKFRLDSTYLAIAKGYDSSGGPVVAFGVGYDVVTALMAIDSTIQGGHWRVDKPWEPVKP